MSLPDIKLTHDKEITIATGASRKSTKWVNSTMLWSELVARLSVPLRTSERMSEYQSMAKVRRDTIKDVGGFVGGKLKAGRRKIENVLERSVVTLDMDTIPTGTEIWPIISRIYDCAAAMYSTHSHTETSNRLRLVIPLSRPVSPDEYGAVSRRIASDVGIDFCDDTTYDPCRLMYWASCSIDAEYVFEYNDGPFLDPDDVLATYHDWTDTAEWPTSSRQTDAITRRAQKQGNPLEKPGAIGAFCKTYDVQAAIEKFLPDVYRKVDENRYTYTKGSTEAGLVLYEKGLFAFSHHGTDPISGQLVNAFDLVRIHKFGLQDEDLPPDTPINKRPSYEHMISFALSDPDVAYQLTLDQVEGAFDEEDGEDPVDTSWLKDLELTSKGDIAATISNVAAILQHDPRLCGSYYYDRFKGRPIVSGDLPWVAYRERISPVWTDTDDAGLRSFLEDEYRIVSQTKIKDAVDIAMLARSRHPVQEYLEGLSWDGIPRMETVFSDYLGAEDCRYTRAVTRAALIGAVARIQRPGCKHDHMLVLVGPQGCRKSTTLAKLGKEWFSDSLYTVSGKDAFEQIQGVWIIEMGEMAAARKSEVEQLKQFMSKRMDSYRAAYGRRTQDHPRQCAFFGSTNDFEFLRDQTGARRFWPVEVDDTGRTEADKLTDEIVDQIWAEAMSAYRSGEHWYLSAEDEDLARQVQAEHTQESIYTGQVLAFLEREVPEGFYGWTLDQRRAYWSGDYFPDEDPVTEPRTKTCIMEVWCEALGGDPRQISHMQRVEIGNILRSAPGWKSAGTVRLGEPYGRQRGYVRSEL